MHYVLGIIAMSNIEAVRATVALLHLICECVVCLAADGDTIMKSDASFDEANGQKMWTYTLDGI